jgi:predicted nucleotidyltransferase
MNRKKSHLDRLEVVYDSFRWHLLEDFRKQAITIMDSLTARRITSAIHGSVVRGDVNKDSDIDIIIPHVLSSHTVELALTMSGFRVYSRRIAQATPSHTPKAHIFLNPEEKQCVTFPLVSFQPLEFEFYKFGGSLELKDIKENKRTPGCDKRLMLIEPTSEGHVESPIEGREAEVASIVGVNVEIVKERVRVLKRRRKFGRTGIVLSVDLNYEEVFEEVLKRLAESNPIVRRRIMKKRRS